ncbi:MAG: beta-ketoacyl-[acyl-carrier-protein] synthase II [Lysobacterales bacterium 66-474]|nr:MAG: beta-ketoacyl-[acyl-carrier-protein] synthase II [Rhodanobacter sp. SCN 66-43]OJY84871.1 MAG: beta-ketoacyl-[acyl-carrier-protein] synthase II [Xanthomonadales bacterium 66-474]
MEPLAISAMSATSALGHGLAAHIDALGAGRGGLAANDFSSAHLDCRIGRVTGVEDVALPAALAHRDCRNNRLAWLGLQQDDLLDAIARIVARHGAARVALVLGTSTASIGSTEDAYRRLDHGHFPADLRRPEIHTPHSLAAFVADATGIAGPALTVSTACSSSAKVFASAERLIRLGLADAALVGGVDTLCDSVLFGFNALELVSRQACRPFDARRDGISIGEAAAFALLERADSAPHAPRLAGYGESSDAHHMSTPHPQGRGALAALGDALGRAGIDANAVDYVNLHGTATPKNDEVEAKLLPRFPRRTRASSTKGFTGHTLGAAGALEAVFALLAIEHGVVPPNLGCDDPIPEAVPWLALQPARQRIDIALSNSFGFGGNNACLVFARGGSA